MASMNRDQELLVITMEECAEVIQECSKLLRFGDTEFDPRILEKEIGDLICMLELMEKRDWISWDKVYRQAAKKEEKLKIWSDLIER